MPIERLPDWTRPIGSRSFVEEALTIPESEGGSPPPTRRARFLSDVLVSVTICILGTAVTGGLINAGGEGLLLAIGFSPLFFFLYPFYFASPLLMCLYGLIRWRPGIVLGVPIFIGGACGLSLAVGYMSQAAFERHATETLESASRPHMNLIFDAEYRSCERLCERILDTTSDEIFISNPNTPTGWLTLRRAQGLNCFTGFGAIGSEGYADRCFFTASAPLPADGLILRSPHNSPREFNGSIREVDERIDGKEKILGGQVVGMVRGALPGVFAPYDIFHGKQIERGPGLTPDEFVAWALHIPIDQVRARWGMSLAERFDTLERYFDEPAALRHATSLWLNLATYEGSKNLDVLVPRLERLLASKEPIRKEAALGALHNVRPKLTPADAARLDAVAKQ